MRTLSTQGMLQVAFKGKERRGLSFTGMWDLDFELRVPTRSPEAESQSMPQIPSNPTQWDPQYHEGHPLAFGMRLKSQDSLLYSPEAYDASVCSCKAILLKKYISSHAQNGP